MQKHDLTQVRSQKSAMRGGGGGGGGGALFGGLGAELPALENFVYL